MSGLEQTYCQLGKAFRSIAQRHSVVSGVGEKGLPGRLHSRESLLITDGSGIFFCMVHGLFVLASYDTGMSSKSSLSGMRPTAHPPAK